MMWLLAYPLTVLLLLLLAKYLWSIYISMNKDDACPLPLPPGPIGWPFIGDMLSFFWINRKNDYFRCLRQQYGSIYKTHLFGKPIVRVSEGECVASLLMREHTHLKNNWITNIQQLIGPHALSSISSELHKSRRKATLKAFSYKSLEKYTIHLKDIANKHLESWCDVGLLTVYNKCESLAFYAACEVLIGIDMNFTDINQFCEEFEIFVKGFFTLPLNLPGTPFQKAMKSRNKMIMILQPLVKDLLAKGPNCRSRTSTSSIDVVLTAHHDLDEDVSDAEIYDRLIEMLFAGHKTAASTMTSIVMFLGQNPHVTDKILEELKQNEINFADDITYRKISSLTYLGYVINETLRLAPPAGGVMREAAQTLQIGGYQIPKGWLVMCSILDTHENDDTWESSDKPHFRPERWQSVDEKSSKIKYNFIPFGIGPRICVGRAYADLLIRIFVASLVLKCEIKLQNPNPQMKRIPILHPVDFLPAYFTAKDV